MRVFSKRLKAVSAFSALFGVALVAFIFQNDFMGGMHSLLYFTVLSNLFLGITQVLILCGSKCAQKLYFMAVVSITLTFLVFCTMLAPFMEGAWSLANVLTHVIAPVAAIADFLFFDRSPLPEKAPVMSTIIPAYIYVAFTVIAYLCRIEFTPGRYYPYTFLNYGGSAGLFGFSTNTDDALFIGSFYWIVILTAIILALAALYAKIHRAMNRHG